MRWRSSVNAQLGIKDEYEARQADGRAGRFIKQAPDLLVRQLCLRCELHAVPAEYKLCSPFSPYSCVTCVYSPGRDAFATKPTGDAPAGPSSSIACTLRLSDTSTFSQQLLQHVVFQPLRDTVQDLEALADSESSPLWLPEQSLERGEIRAQIWIPPTARSQLLTQRSVPAEFHGGAWTRLLNGPRRSRLRGLIRRIAETKSHLAETDRVHLKH
ncbi:hypothetical protein GGI43DRAFT_200449 [Trichoderma evansii]